MVAGLLQFYKGYRTGHFWAICCLCGRGKAEKGCEDSVKALSRQHEDKNKKIWTD
jgi:hypothetical protein